VRHRNPFGMEPGFPMLIGRCRETCRDLVGATRFELVTSGAYSKNQRRLYRRQQDRSCPVQASSMKKLSKRATNCATPRPRNATKNNIADTVFPVKSFVFRHCEERLSDVAIF